MRIKLYIVIGILVCLCSGGCGNADKAISFSVGESLEEKDMQAEGVGNAMDTQDGLPEPDGELCVYVCGAVNNPGVVFLPAGSRCNDALEAAGGFAEDAAMEAVNLAKALADGEKIYFPTREEYEVVKESEESSQSGLININEAGSEMLCTLPGIGAAKAKAIIDYREDNGAFAAIEDIMQVPGIKESAYSQICDLITVQ